MKKRWISVCLALSLLLGASSALAAGSEMAALPAVQQELLTKVTGLLQGMQADPSADVLYPDVDFTALSLGTQIPAYVVEPDGPAASDIAYYPVLDADGELVFLVTATDAGGQLYVQITTQLVDELRACLAENSALALVYDRDGLYALSTAGSTTLAAYETEVVNRAVLETEEAMAILTAASEEMESNHVADSIQLNQNAALAMQVQSVAYSHYLTVPIILQQNYDGTVNDFICWACTAASIGNYYTGRTDTGRYFATTMNMMNQYGDYADILDILQNRYFLTGFTRYSQSTVPLAVGTVGSKLEASHPIGVIFREDLSEYGHWMVLRGYWGDNMMAYFSAMDPYSSTYTTGTLLDSYDRPDPPYYDKDSWSYIHVINGTKMYLREYFYRS